MPLGNYIPIPHPTEVPIENNFYVLVDPVSIQLVDEGTLHGEQIKYAT